MTLADKISYVDEVREIFGDEAAEELAGRIGLGMGSSLAEAALPGAGDRDPNHGFHDLEAGSLSQPLSH